MVSRNSFANNLGLNAYQSSYQVTNLKNFAGNLGLNVLQNVNFMPSDVNRASQDHMDRLEANNHGMNLADRRRASYYSNRESLVNRYQK
ncbi:hypothetical protein [Acetilactobacillus jinshanensis]|uniref:Uncharacterized protein n=1 Tax=Acetilactobacillus jinshanensis TaxID=1720083 RepID=A0A4P6ZKI3_9LACO|nr:hypothetical protein [Acetilactobacillus jinshanensis]QBP18168.1 hypothetical protein ELX58_03230 [Acetilactobacillus jinshanensis]URL61035.1 hypothetical protein HGK75_03290 [uncultured bacterium]